MHVIQLAGVLGFGCLLCLLTPSHAVEPTQRDVEYARLDGQVLELDFYAAADSGELSPLVIWIHGGAWRSGSKDQVPITGLLERGFAIASVEYRLSPVARFPAQVHDIKAAIRFLRFSAERLQLDPERFIIAGASAGGHLAALVGVSAGVQELEGNIGSHLSESSAVQAIVSFYGAANLETILAQSTPHGLSVRVPALQLLLGGQPAEQPRLARLASPVAHVDSGDPPLWLLHGDQDPQMPINQAHELEGAYKAAGLTVDFQVVHGAAHGGPQFTTPARLDQLAQQLP